ncbi:monooxygenase 2-like [Triticum aestivum]|nr:monooxygenase 2-like [Triticum aestivum]
MGENVTAPWRKGENYRIKVEPGKEANIPEHNSFSPNPTRPCTGTTPDTVPDGDAEESVAKMRRLVLARLTAAKIPAEALDVVERSKMSEVVLLPLRFRSPLALVQGSICRGGVCVAGDAFHPMTPELGQGGCAALEDGVVLARCLGEAFAVGGHGNAEAALEKYAKERRWRAIRLVTAAYVVGFVQQSSNPAIKFLREKFLSGLLARVMVDMADYDCGKL